MAGPRRVRAGRAHVGSVAHPTSVSMQHVAAVERIYNLTNHSDVDGFRALLADDVVDHEVTADFTPDGLGVTPESRMYRAASPDMRVGP
jgi:hypothetical protein